ncbi:hypothetical protein IJO12_08605 [bacterium]|nr:hypothetical protein [bacterium]
MKKLETSAMIKIMILSVICFIFFMLVLNAYNYLPKTKTINDNQFIENKLNNEESSHSIEY